MRHVFVGCAAVAVALLPMPAAAVVNTIFFSGTLFDARDWTGLFGVANGNLGRRPYLLGVTFDTSLPSRFTSRGTDELFSGDLFGAPSAVSDVAITINGVTRHFVPNQIAVVATTAGTGGATIDAEISDDGTTTSLNTLFAYGLSAAASGSLDSDLSAIRITPTQGGFAFYSYDDATGLDTVDTYGNFLPEPATWGLMLTGFGLTGIALRRRARRRTI